MRIYGPVIWGIYLNCVLVLSKLPRSAADGGYEYDNFGEGSGVYPDVTDNPETKCNCVFDQYDDDDDEMKCLDQDDGFERAFRCKNYAKVFLGGKCRDESSKFSHFCDGIEVCPGEEPREIFGFKCPIYPALETPELSRESCTIPQKYITRWRGRSLTNSNIVHAICPDGEDICFQNGTTLLNTSKCYQCIDGDVININQVCDGKADCRDLSDECLCQNKSDFETQDFCNHQTKCLSNQIVWKNNSGKYQCIDIDDMETMDLEYEGCPHCTPKSKDQNITKCDGTVNGLTALKTISCDKRPRCSERLEDECENCAVRSEYCDYYWQGMIHCEFINETKRHMPNEFLLICDGRVDCKNGIDEKGCNRHNCSADGSSDHTYDPLERCDSKEDCPQGEDEMNCTNVFYCPGNISSWLPMEKVGDGHIDCKKGEDECNYEESSFSSGQDMMKSPVMLICTWIMAILAIFGNCLVIRACIKELYEICKRGAVAENRMRICNIILVLNLALADFLMGIYLVILGIRAIQYDGIFCLKWQEWRSSNLCSIIGAFAMLSSQASVLTIVIMTTYRLFCSAKPFKADRLKVKYLMTCILVFCWLPSIVLAFLPLRDNSMAFAFQPTTKLPHFTRFMIKKLDMEEFLQKALRFHSNATEPILNNQWMDMIHRYQRLFPEAYGPKGNVSIVSKWYGYYSADSVCLPRLFPQVGDNGWRYTAGLILFDLISFVYVAMIYAFIFLREKRRLAFETTRGYDAQSRGSPPNSEKNMDRLRSRITRLIITDFICWMPICIMCIVTLSGHKVPPFMYQLSAIIFLPVNSALNPVVYSSKVYRTFIRLLCKSYKIIGSRVESGVTGEESSNSSQASGVLRSRITEARQLTNENRLSSISEDHGRRNTTPMIEMTPLVPISQNQRCSLARETPKEELREGPVTSEGEEYFTDA